MTAAYKRIHIILNASALGGMLGMPLSEIAHVDISDGLLDLYAITATDILRAI